MLRDASQKQVIQKFSFIESLNLSRKTNLADRQISQEIEIGDAFNFVPQTNLKSSNAIAEKVTEATAINQENSAIIAAVKTANLAVNSDYPHSETSYPGMGEIIKYSNLDYQPHNYPPQERNYLGKILFALACSYGLFVLWWLFGHQGSKFMTRMMGGRHITLSKSEAEFIDYMESSLLSIDRELEANKAASEGENKVVYVPVYTPKNTPTISAPVVTAQPKPQAFNRALPPTPKALKIPAPPPLPSPTPLPQNEPSQPSANVGAIVPKPLAKRTLTGILDLGVGKSAALVKVNGQTRRFWLGEEISNSGWILESITNQTARINYQGQVRSITVGETF